MGARITPLAARRGRPALRAPDAAGARPLVDGPSSPPP
jgi:hypothetical protein